MRNSKKCFVTLCSAFALLVLSACQSIDDNPSYMVSDVNGVPVAEYAAIRVSANNTNHYANPMSMAEGFILSPLSNESVTLVAAQAATTLLETHLRARGVPLGLIAEQRGRYVISGKVSRWHYQGKVSGRPDVALSIDVTDRSTKKVVWSDSAVATGARRQTLSGLADQLLSRLTAKIPLTGSRESIDSNMMIASSEPAGLGSFNEPALGGAVTTDDLTTSSIQETRYFLNTNIQTDKLLQGRSVAFYYAAKPPIDVLSQFDRVVVEADNMTPAELQKIKLDGSRIYAYLSVGEVGPERSYVDSIDPSWVLGINPSWNSKILDLTNPAVRKFLLSQVGTLQKDGYQGLFLDTMDSFNFIAKTDEQRAAQSTGLTSLIREMASGYPDLRLITNRGFEVLDDVAQHIEAVAAESLYAGWDNTKQAYIDVPAGDRQWLRNKLDHVKNKLGLDVIVIDYLPPSKRLAARAVAEKIAEDGFIPWVANPTLDYVGLGALEVIPRKVLMLYNSNVDGALVDSKVHKFVAMPIEYMGYVPEYLDIAKESLPEGELKGRYAGIVTWPLSQYSMPSLTPWFEKQLFDKVPVAFMGMPPVVLNESMQNSLGINVAGTFDTSSALIVKRDQLIKPERKLSQRIESMALVAQSSSSGNTVHLGYEDKKQRTADMIVTGGFGGFAWSPVVMQNGVDYQSLWVVEPFEFLRKALQLPNVPMPDVTTENGRRLWLAHIDGDALPSWAEMPGKRLGADVIYDEILKPYDLPHSVSIVEGEMTQLDAYADRRARMFSTVRKTFALDNVELASHTFSHPFNWSAVEKHKFSGKYNLDVKGYLYSAERETQGSIEFIDSELAPAGKRTEVMLWSGSALPGEAELAVLDKLDIPNMNGGMTLATNATRSMTLVGPMTRPVGKYVQVYAPIMNENVYTNDWLGPFDGFKRVVETFEITETPRRIKPINIYYHFYTGTKISAMKALRDVYDWSVSQDIYPIYGSEFARKVPDHRDVGVARYLTGEWKVARLGNIRSLRVLDSKYFPVLDKTQGIVGSRKLHDGVYIHTNGSDSVSFQTTLQRPKGVHLVSSNGRVEQWEKSYNGLALRIKGQVPVVLELGGAQLNNCSIRAGGAVVRGVLTAAQTTLFTFTKKDTGNAILHCPA
ncbi:endo alpha-1,4 polygalactosaminidase [Granulosicoccus sp.]|nr:endo alpha-1,4 polygalactosaminidase [Granulosicoccus sp.]MDB4224012.1 endo alpha-1,4 polygalactosaminidase [Granulosicoccus sp.]